MKHRALIKPGTYQLTLTQKIRSICTWPLMTWPARSSNNIVVLKCYKSSDKDATILIRELINDACIYIE